MSQLVSFHDVSFPVAIALGASGGPVRRTEVVTLGSGHEQRNARWAHSRRRYDAGLGIRTVDQLHTILGFFEARGGRLFGFRFRDPIDHNSCPPGTSPSAVDQTIGEGDGATERFNLVKSYGGDPILPPRPILKPVEGSVLIAVDGVTQSPGNDFLLDASTGVVSFTAGSVPDQGALVTAGFEFDVPVRFDTDEIVVSLTAFEAGSIPSIPLMELHQ